MTCSALMRGEELGPALLCHALLIPMRGLTLSREWIWGGGREKVGAMRGEEEGETV